MFVQAYIYCLWSCYECRKMQPQEVGTPCQALPLTPHISRWLEYMGPLRLEHDSGMICLNTAPWIKIYITSRLWSNTRCSSFTRYYWAFVPCPTYFVTQMYFSLTLSDFCIYPNEYTQPFHPFWRPKEGRQNFCTQLCSHHCSAQNTSCKARPVS